MLINALILPKTEKIEAMIEKHGSYKVIPYNLLTGEMMPYCDRIRIAKFTGKYTLDKGTYAIVFWSTKGKEDLGIRSKLVSTPVEQIDSRVFTALSRLEVTRKNTYYDDLIICITCTSEMVEEIQNLNVEKDPKWLIDFFEVNKGIISQIEKSKMVYYTTSRGIPCILE